LNHSKVANALEEILTTQANARVIIAKAQHAKKTGAKRGSPFRKTAALAPLAALEKWTQGGCLEKSSFLTQSL
jgi:hypothetical protein